MLPRDESRPAPVQGSGSSLAPTQRWSLTKVVRPRPDARDFDALHVTWYLADTDGRLHGPLRTRALRRRDQPWAADLDTLLFHCHTVYEDPE